MDEEQDYRDWLLRYPRWPEVPPFFPLREQVTFGMMLEWPHVAPCFCHPFRDPVSAARAAARRLAEAEDRQAWIEGVRRRLGLVAEVHRCRVWKRGEGDWAAQCLRPGCPPGRPLGWAPSMEYALGDALAHAGHYLPLPPEPEPVTELHLLTFDGLVPLLR